MSKGRAKATYTPYRKPVKVVRVYDLVTPSGFIIPHDVRTGLYCIPGGEWVSKEQAEIVAANMEALSKGKDTP